MPFLGDDFVILERVKDASFWDLWRVRGPMLFGWYRPVSRELHYWILRGLAGTHEPLFHFVSFALWLGVLVLFHRYLHRLAGPRAAAIATAGAACLSVWGGPLVWIAGAQDLWMLLFGFAFLLAMQGHRTKLAAVWLALALLSKESAGLFVVVALTADFWANRLGPRAALRAYWPSLAILIVWTLVHPTLLARISGHVPSSTETASRPGMWWIALRSVAAVFDFDTVPAPEGGWSGALLLGAVAALPLLALVLSAWKRENDTDASVPRARLLGFASTWSVAGFVVPLVPSLGWHAYYAIIGLLGMWAAIAVGLSRHRTAAVTVVVLMGFLRAARADTPTWDWGSESYQTRAGSILRSLRAQMEARHPSLAPHTRVFFTHVPNNVGLIAGDSPVLRVWYGDPTLQARFLRDFTVRSPGDPTGPDFFVFLDNAGRLEELEPAVEGARRTGLTPEWQARYYNLATAFLYGGDVEGAAREYLAIARGDPGRKDCAMFAAAAYEVAGRPRERDEALQIARAAGMPDEEIDRQMHDLVTHFPRVRAASSARSTEPADTRPRN